MSAGAVLAVDTSFGPIAAALAAPSGDSLASDSRLDTLGAQAETLAPMVQRLLAGAGVAPAEIARIAVTVGPGAFTGVRVGLAFAKGMAAALNVPLLGFTTLACLAAQARAKAKADVYVAAIDARRGEFYVQAFDARLAPLFDAAVMSGPDAIAAIARLAGSVAVVGSGAALLVPQLSRPALALNETVIDAVLLARAALTADPASHPPRPCYLRAPDARLPS